MLGKIKSQAKGLIGEAEVGMLCRDLQQQYSFEYFHNLPIPYENGDTQIDIAIVSRKGFYVLEVKNWSGIVSASEKARYWRVVYSEEKFVPNPILQNEYHIRKLSAITKSKYTNIVLFPDSTQIENRCKNVWRYSDLKYIFTRVKDVYTDAEVKQECARLAALRQSMDISRLAKYMVKSEQKKKGDSDGSLFGLQR